MMLGDYFKYNARPVDWQVQPRKKEEHKVVTQEQPDSAAIPSYSDEAEDGYDPYNHPIDRKIIERHSEK